MKNRYRSDPACGCSGDHVPEEELEALGRFLATLSNVEKLEVLPYHSMGKVKYDNLGMDYALKDTPQLTKAEAKSAESIILEAMRQRETSDCRNGSCRE